MQPPSTDSNEFRQEHNGRLKKSVSADILNHPPLPRFPRYDVKRNQRSSTETTSSGGYVPPLPQVMSDDRNLADDPNMGLQIAKSEMAANLPTATKKKNASMSNLASELTFQNLTKFNYSSMDEFNNNPSADNFNPNSANINPLAYQNQTVSVIDIIPKPAKPDIDQTIGIPLAFDAADHSGNAFYQPQYSAVNNNYEVSNEYEYHQVPTTIHQYPLISGTIPSTTQSKINYSTMPTPTMHPKKKDGTGPTGSILTNAGNSAVNNVNGAGSKKESGERNKVKFSDTITVAVVPEISRKSEKIVNFNDRMKRKTVYPGMMMDPRRELAESLPLSHPNEDYLKDFSPVSDRQKDAPTMSSKGSEDKKKPAIKVVHFGVV